MAKSRTRAKADKAEAVGRKNLLINGGFDVWQRGTSHNPNSVRYGSTDRWWTWCSTSGATASQEATDTDGATYAFKFTTPSGNTVDIRQGIEILNSKQVTKGGGNLTLSFKAKYPSGSDVNVEVRYADNLSFANSATALSLQSIGQGTGSWETYSVTFSDVTPVSGNLGLMLRIAGGAASSDHLISNVQLELGSVATDFEHRSYGEELALCQRYYQYHGNNNQMLIGWSYCGTNEHCWGSFQFPKMRVAPTATYTGTAHSNCAGDITVSGIATTPSSLEYMNTAPTSLPAGYFVSVPNLWLDAEL